MKFKTFLIFFILLGSLLVSKNLTVWVSWEGLSFFEEKAEEFNKDTGHNIEILFVPNMEEKLLTSIKTGNLPDLALIKDVHSGYLSHVNTLYRIKDEDLEQLGTFRKDDLKVFSVNNEIVAIPYYADLQVAFVNQKILKESGHELSFDYTIDDIREIKDDFENSEIFPAAWDFMSPYVFYPFAVHDAELIDENGKLQMDTDFLAETIRNIKELFDENIFERYERGALIKGFSSGKIAIILQGSYLSPTFEQNETSFEILPFPVMNDKRIKGLIDAKGFAILNRTKQDIALEFIVFLYSNSNSYCEKYYKVPLWTESNSEKLKDLRAVLKESQYMEQSENFQRLYFRVMRTVLQSVYSETMTVEESLQNAQEFVNKNW
ncbi:MAG: extracellular solute-binding protein [Thermotogota bacterium]|nr:extracellular solute-binding protein [Thermotogota bacterium]